MYRNPEATCSTCPYLFLGKYCHRMAELALICGKEVGDPEKFWCGEHPDFFINQAWTYYSPKVSSSIILDPSHTDPDEFMATHLNQFETSQEVRI